MDWKTGLKIEFKKLEDKANDLMELGFTEDSPEVQWFLEEFEHFQQMADKMVEEAKKDERFCS
jgi:hypothetical protein